jgi:hypothetical protein
MVGENKFSVRQSNPASLNTMNKAVDIPEYDIFTKTKDDDKPGMSYEDKIYLKQMNDQFTKDSTGSWVSPAKQRQIPTFLILLQWWSNFRMVVVQYLTHECQKCSLLTAFFFKLLSRNSARR